MVFQTEKKYRNLLAHSKVCHLKFVMMKVSPSCTAESKQTHCCCNKNAYAYIDRIQLHRPELPLQSRHQHRQTFSPAQDPVNRTTLSLFDLNSYATRSRSIQFTSPLTYTKKHQHPPLASRCLSSRTCGFYWLTLRIAADHVCVHVKL